MATVNNLGIPDLKLAKYLQIAVKQRKRALQKFVDDYGPESSTVAECSGEIAELEIAINSLVKAAAQGVGTQADQARTARK